MGHAEEGWDVYNGFDTWHSADGRNRAQPGVLHMPTIAEMETLEL